MAGTFENVTRIAIEEIVKKNASPSKFGYILSEESFKDLVEDFYHLLLTSRSLKSAGDRFLRGGFAKPTERTKTISR